MFEGSQNIIHLNLVEIKTFERGVPRCNPCLCCDIKTLQGVESIGVVLGRLEKLSLEAGLFKLFELCLEILELRLRSGKPLVEGFDGGCLAFIESALLLEQLFSWA